VLIAGDGRICFSNTGATAVLREEDGLLGEGARLRAAVREDDARLQRLIANACGLTEDVLRGGGTMAVRRPSGALSLTLEVLPLGETAPGCGRSAARAAVYISDPCAEHTGSKRMLAQAFGLTPMEAQVCLLLLEGGSLKTVAQQLGVSHNTVRTHLAHVFDKTGVRRQAELVKLLVSAMPGTRSCRGPG